MEVAPQRTEKLKVYMEWTGKLVLREHLAIAKKFMSGQQLFLSKIYLIQIVNVLFSFALCVVLDYAEYTYK